VQLTFSQHLSRVWLRDRKSKPHAVAMPCTYSSAACSSSRVELDSTKSALSYFWLSFTQPSSRQNRPFRGNEEGKIIIISVCFATHLKYSRPSLTICYRELLLPRAHPSPPRGDRVTQRLFCSMAHQICDNSTTLFPIQIIFAKR
jgi:hypothetical protein